MIVRPYLELSRPRVTVLVLFTTAIGFYLGSGAEVADTVLAHALVGTGMVAGGASALNQYVERDHDRRMRRTSGRPLPSGRIHPRKALFFAAALSLAGVAYLGLFTNSLTAALAAATLVLYLFAYTPLKTRTALATVVGAVPGAFPPILGWTAAGGSLDLAAWTLFLTLFLWQLPHFTAIAWIYRDDYVSGGFRPLAIDEAHQRQAGAQVVVCCLALLLVGLVPAYSGRAGGVYMFGALAANAGYLGYGLHLAAARSPSAARQLLKASLLHLPVLLLVIVCDTLV